MSDKLFDEEQIIMPKTEIVKETTFKSFIHNNEICDEIVKWGKANSYEVQKAKNYKKLNAYIGFGDGFFIQAIKLPPVPGGWKVTVEKFEPTFRIIALNVDENGTVNTYMAKMIKEYEKDGLKTVLSDETYDSYGTLLRDLKVIGHPILINAFEDFVENMR